MTETTVELVNRFIDLDTRLSIEENPEEKQRLENELYELVKKIYQKGENIYWVIQELKKRKKLLEAEYDHTRSILYQLDDKITATEKQINRLQELIHILMESVGVSKLSTNIANISTAISSGSVVVEDESLIPKKYVTERVIQKVDITAIKNDIESGIEVPGCKLVKKKYLIIK